MLHWRLSKKNNSQYSEERDRERDQSLMQVHRDLLSIKMSRDARVSVCVCVCLCGKTDSGSTSLKRFKRDIICSLC